jgi:F0F1-type ATP synthase assembly protein I
MNGQDNGTRAEFSQRAAAAEGRAEGLNVGWTVFSYLLSGMAAYGIIGWLIGRALHLSLLFPIGMLIGLGISIAFIIYRYGKQGAVSRASLPRGGLGGSPPRASTEGDNR